MASTQSYSKTKSIHINNNDNNYQHDSSDLPSNHEATFTTNNNNSFLWNRAKNPGVWTKSQFMNRLLVPPMRRLLNPNHQQPSNHDVWSKPSYDLYRNNRVNIISQHQSEFMSLPLNYQIDCSSTTTTQTSNNNQYPIAITNGISNLLKIDKMKIHQQNVTNYLSISTKTKKDILITPTQPTITPTMYPILDKQPTNSEKLRNEQVDHTMFNKTTYTVGEE